MDVDQALELLGLGRDASWTDIRGHYRSRVRAMHPDLADDPSSATAPTAALNEAYAVLAAATGAGTVAVGPRAAMPTQPEEPELTIMAPPGDVFVLLLEASERLGHVSYVSPEDGLVQVLIEADGTHCQLVAEVLDAEPPRIAFSLAALDAGTAPPIESVVGRLVTAMEGEFRTL